MRNISLVMKRGIIYQTVIWLYMSLFLMTSTDATPKLSPVSKGSGDFTARFQKTAENMIGDQYNFVTSPVAVMQHIVLFAQATGGEMQTKLMNQMGTDSINSLTRAFQSVAKKLHSSNGDISLKLANNFYLNEGIKLNSNLTKAAKDWYSTEINTVNFAEKDEVISNINEWASEKTEGQIDNTITTEDIQKPPNVYMVNVVSFKGKWMHGFSEVIPEAFFKEDGSNISVPLMFTSNNFLYAEVEDLDAKMIELPYAGDRSAMLLLLPRNPENLQEMEDKLLNMKNYADLVQQLRERPVQVWLPKFSITSRVDVKDVLSKMGLETLFSEEIGLVSAADGHKGICAVEQFVRVDVNEGTNTGTTGMLSDKPVIQLRFDRPFFFAIAVNSVVTILGKYTGEYTPGTPAVHSGHHRAEIVADLINSE